MEAHTGQQYTAIRHGNTIYNINVFVLIYINCVNNINKTVPSKTDFLRLIPLNKMLNFWHLVEHIILSQQKLTLLFENCVTIHNNQNKKVKSFPSHFSAINAVNCGVLHAIPWQQPTRM